MGKFQVNYDWKEGVEGFNEKTSGGMEFNKGDIVTGEASGSWLKVNRGGEYGFIPLNRVDQDGAELAAEKAAAEKARTAARVAEDRLKAPLIGERRDAEVLGASCRVPTDFEIDNAQEGCAPFLIDGVMKHGEKCDKIRCEADPITKEMPTPKGAWPRCTHGVFDDGTVVCQYEEDALEAEVSDASQRASAEQRRQDTLSKRQLLTGAPSKLTAAPLPNFLKDQTRTVIGFPLSNNSSPISIPPATSIPTRSGAKAAR